MLLEQQISPKNPIFFIPSSPRLRRGDHPLVDPSLLNLNPLVLTIFKYIIYNNTPLFRRESSDVTGRAAVLSAISDSRRQQVEYAPLGEPPYSDDSPRQ